MKDPLICILCPLLTFDCSCPVGHSGLLFTKINFFSLQKHSRTKQPNLTHDYTCDIEDRGTHLAGLPHSHDGFEEAGNYGGNPRGQRTFKMPLGACSDFQQTTNKKLKPSGPWLQENEFCQLCEFGSRFFHS